MPLHKCAVIIPTKNAMPGLGDVLSQVLSQETPWPYEVIVIDSGSSDGTTEFVRALSVVRLIEIAPETFGHGRTRNQAIAAADAEFVALLTHDAEPCDQQWLANLVSAAEQDPEIAGVFGRHTAVPSASPFTKADLDRHFQSFGNGPHVVSKALDDKRYEQDPAWRQALHYYSDNNSLMRKSVWEKHPYPDVEFAEDQIWAREIIEAGFSKAYAPEAMVYHSHDYAPMEQLRRAFDESRNFKKYFGYRLSASPLSALAAVIKNVAEAFLNAPDETRYGPVTLDQKSLRARQRGALIVGHFLGAHHERLPETWAQWLSLDHRLFRS